MQSLNNLISIHAPRTGATGWNHCRSQRGRISIHAPRTGSDGIPRKRGRRGRISIHAPHARGATVYVVCLQAISTNFNPRSPHGERPFFSAPISTPTDFNPRSPHGERQGASSTAEAAASFQSTLPARGATPKGFPCMIARIISIHAPRTGSDSVLPPCGLTQLSFQSTLPARGATSDRWRSAVASGISIHAPRTGSDTLRSSVPRVLPNNFNPRSPHGERPIGRSLSLHPRNISIHAPRTGSDLYEHMWQGARAFQSTLPARGATHLTGGGRRLHRAFQSTLPARGATNEKGASK